MRRESEKCSTYARRGFVRTRARARGKDAQTSSDEESEAEEEEKEERSSTAERRPNGINKPDVGCSDTPPPPFDLALRLASGVAAND
jgi:hypothetical protein